MTTINRAHYGLLLTLGMIGLFLCENVATAFSASTAGLLSLQVGHCRRRRSSSSFSGIILFDQANNQNENNNEDDTAIDEFLDTPFFDPDAVTEDDPAPLRWFADLVKNDYATAETLYAGALFVVMVIISQELLRMQIYGEGYVPFQPGVKPGQLF